MSPKSLHAVLDQRLSAHNARTNGERIADSVTGFMGSWRFIIIQSVIVSAWIFLNFYARAKHFDPYPFILLNLLFSTQAAYAAPLILMSGNRQAAKDREMALADDKILRDDHTIITKVDQNITETRQLAGKMDAEMAIQTEMLRLLREHLEETNAS